MPPCYDCNTAESINQQHLGRTYCPFCHTQQHFQCSNCTRTISWDNAFEDSHSYRFCLDCHSHIFIACHDCGISREDITTHNGRNYCENCVQNYQRHCDICGENSRPVNTTYFGNHCQSCHDINFVECTDCGSDCRIADAFEIEDGWICASCEASTSEWGFSEFNPNTNSYIELESKLTYGIEIETSTCKGFSALQSKTIWGCTNDYSIAGKEFVSPPLCGDKGLDVIKEFCAEADNKKWSVDSHCGLHLHLGVEGLSTQELKSIALAYYVTQHLWINFVSGRRAADGMCATLEYARTEITKIETDEDWDYFVGERDRFDCINWRAYMVHGTIELRLLNGTLDSEHICNWIKMHTKFIDCVKSMSTVDIELMFDGSIFYQFSALTEIIGEDLSSFYVGVADTHGRHVREPTCTSTPF